MSREIVLVVKYSLKYGSSNEVSIPTVDTALIPLCHTQFLSQNRMLIVCVPKNQVYTHTV
jgi:hypothetical protein